ncbi:hypothetical protein ACSSVW_003238 [Pseudoalteromonas sp. MBR-15]|jgi:hypothetical protein
MKKAKENDKSKAICVNCESVVVTTFQYRDVPLSDKSVVVNNVLVAVCDNCDGVVSIPHQEAEKIKQTLNNVTE